MTLKKQSIRKNHTITSKGHPITKEEIITMSELWDENQEKFFKKMLRQGGRCKINNVPFEIELDLKFQK